jgi:hypothetical protein
MSQNDFDRPKSSQDSSPKSQKSQSQKSRPPKSRPPKSQSSVPQPPAPKQTPSIVKTIGIKALRTTIQGLETLVEKLETEPSTSEQPADSGVHRPRKGWQKVLFQIRSRLPQSLDRKLNDRALTGIVAGVAVLLVWVSSTLFSSKPPTVAIAPTPQVPVEKAPQPLEKGDSPAKANTSTPVGLPEQPTESFPSELSSPESSEVPVAAEPKTTTPQEALDSSSSEPPSDSAKSVAEVETPSVAPEPLAPESLPEPSPQSSTPERPAEPALPEPPKVELTPEESLIASIEGQVTEISDHYISALIQAVQPNFRNSRLVVQVSTNWYELSADQQNRLANEILARSQDLDFIRLDIRDATGTLLARSPVVGTSMVILKRTLDPQKTV